MWDQKKEIYECFYKISFIDVPKKVKTSHGGKLLAHLFVKEWLI